MISNPGFKVTLAKDVMPLDNVHLSGTDYRVVDVMLSYDGVAICLYNSELNCHSCVRYPYEKLLSVYTYVGNH